METIQILSIVGVYALSLISITLFCIAFSCFYKKKNLKRNIFFVFFFINFSVEIILMEFLKLTSENYRFDEDSFKVKVISPNFSMSDYYNNSEKYQIREIN